MRETQETIGRWADETFPGADPGTPRKAIRALEEMVELCLADGATAREIIDAAMTEIDKTIRKHVEGYDAMNPGEKARFWARTYPQPDKVASEGGDVLVTLYGHAALKGYDLHDAVDRKMEVNRARRWKANGDGTGYHIRES